jgi:hypothetical protein
MLMFGILVRLAIEFRNLLYRSQELSPGMNLEHTHIEKQLQTSQYFSIVSFFDGFLPPLEKLLIGCCHRFGIVLAILALLLLI